MKTVAARDEVAIETSFSAILPELHVWPFTGDVEKLRFLGFVDHGAVVARADPVKLFCYGGLAEGRHRLASVLFGVDQKERAILPSNPGAGVNTALTIHAFAESDVSKKFHGAIFQHAGTD